MSNVDTIHSVSSPSLPTSRALRRRQLMAVQRGAALRPNPSSVVSTRQVGDVLATPRLTPALALGPSARPSLAQAGVALREVARPHAPSAAIVRRAADLWQGTPSANRNAHPMRLVVAHALMAAPEQHSAMLAELEAAQVLTPAAHQKLTAALAGLAGHAARPVSAIAAPEHFTALLAALPFPVAEALVQARGKAIQEQLDSWSEDLREQAKLDAEAQKRAHDVASRRAQVTLSHRLAQYQQTRTQVQRSLAQAAVERALVRLAQVSPQPEVFGSTRASNDVPYAVSAVRGHGIAARSGEIQTETSLHSAASSLRALSPTTLRAALSLANGTPVVQQPYTPNYRAAFAAPSSLAQGPSLRQPSHALEAVDLPGRAIL